MSTSKSMLCALGAAPFLSACGSIPDLPPDAALPVSSIINEAVCQIRSAFRKINEQRIQNPEDPALKSFHPDDWAVSLLLTPQTTAWYGAGLSGSYKSNPYSIKGIDSFTANLASLGANIPAANTESRGNTQATVNYNISTAVFFDNTYDAPLATLCDDKRQKNQAVLNVSRNLSVDDWLSRIISPADGKIISIAAPDRTSFSYTVSIIISSGAGGGASFTGPPAMWTVGAAAGARRQQDVSLALTFTQQDAKPPVVIQKTPARVPKLPSKSSQKGKRPTVPVYVIQPTGSAREISPGAIERLDNLQQYSVPSVRDRFDR